MAGFKQAKSDFRLRLEAKDSSAFVVPEVMITLVDKLEAVGDPVKEQLGALEIVWVKVKCTKGEGFADNEKLQDFVEPAPVPDEELEIEFRRSIELTTLAELCYRNALRHHTNSALLLALARTATGDQWTDKLAKPKEGGDRIGIYGFTQSEWDAVLVGIPPEVDVKPDHIARARAQCEIASFVSGRHWQALIAARGEDVRAIDLYLAFLFGADVAIKILNADKVSLSTFLTAAEVQAVSARMASVVPGPAITADTQQNALIKALVDKLQTAFDFVKAFAESLMIDQQPAPQDEIIKTEDEIDHEDPIDGEDDPIGPDSPIVVQDVAEAAPQPGDGTLLISEAHLVALWKRSLFPIDGRGMILFGLRGCLPADPSATEFRSSHKVKLADVDYRRMRCTIGQWRPGKGFALFPGSTVPFVTLVDSATNRKGAGVNQMGRGRYKNYVSGWHKRREGRKKGHWALLQESDISFQRTPSDVNYTPDDPWQAGRPGDNIHCAFHMGAPDKLAESRYSSAGCQVVAGRVVKGRKGSEEGPWGKFIAPFLDDLDQSGFEYVLFDGRELERMVQTKMSGKTVVLRMGSEGAPVADLQQRLGLADPDGKFGPNTFRAVIKFQHQNFPKSADDGIVGPQTAERLGMTLPQFVFADAIKGLSVEEPGPGSGAGPGTGSGPGAGAGAGGGGLCWGKVTNQLHGPAFKQKVRDISSRLGCNPNHLMAVMAFETGRTFSPKVKNPSSSATGLIQFMADTAVGLGTTTAKLATMTALKQLDFVEKYLKPHTGDMKTVSDIYMAVLRPVSVGKPEGEVLFKKGSKAYKVNKGLDINKDGRITKAEAAAKVVAQLKLGMTAENFG